MMRMLLTICLLLIILGCSNKESTLDPAKYNSSDTPVELTKVSESKGLDQHITNQAKGILSGRDDLTSIKAANSSDKLIIAIEPLHRERFDLEGLRKEVKRELNSRLPKVSIEISTDKKIYLELDKLEKEIQNRSISKEELDKRINKIQKLDDEQT